MRTRAKALTVAVAMVTTFAILPTLGAAAAEPLADGSYDVVIGEQTYTVAVVQGVPEIEGADGVEFTFTFDEDTERVLDEFDVAVDGVTYEVEVGDDGAVTVTEEEGEEPADEGESEDDGEEESEGDEDSSDDLETLAETETLTETEDDADDADEDDGAHGALVSTVAQCAPNGRQARDAGLPNHGFFVSAAAKGEEVEFDVAGETHTFDLSSQEGADAFCALAERLLATAESDLDAAATDEVEDGDEGRGKSGERGNGKGKARADAPGQLKKNG